MITELTKEQEANIEVYLKKWLDIGYRTKPITQEEAIAAAKFLYDIAELQQPEIVVVLDSPLECQYACNLIDDNKIHDKLYDKIRDKIHYKIDDKIHYKIYSKLRDKIYAKICENIDDKINPKIEDKIYAKIRDKLYDNIYDKIKAKINAKIRDKLYDKIYDKIKAKINAKIDDKISNKLYDKIRANNFAYHTPSRSNLWNSWFSMQDYIFNELIKDNSKEGILLNDFLKSSAIVHQIYCFENICFISDFPTEININQDGSLHHQDKAALTYKDGFSLYYSNRIEMHEKYILTPADQITKEDFLGEENADMKRELILKLGLPRVLEMLGANVLDTMETQFGGKYELLECNLHENVKGKYLKMQCPSTKNYHILGVSNESKTALDAYKDLNNGLTPEEMVWEA